MDWRRANDEMTRLRAARGVRHVFRAKGERHPKEHGAPQFRAKKKLPTEKVHPFWVTDSGDVVLDRPDPTHTYRDGEHVHIEGIEFPDDIQVEQDPQERARRAKLLQLLREWVVGHKVLLSASAERDDANRLSGTISWPKGINPSGMEQAKGWSLDQVLTYLNLAKYHPPVEKK